MSLAYTGYYISLGTNNFFSFFKMWWIKLLCGGLLPSFIWMRPLGGAEWSNLPLVNACAFWQEERCIDSELHAYLWIIRLYVWMIQDYFYYAVCYFDASLVIYLAWVSKYGRRTCYEHLVWNRMDRVWSSAKEKFQSFFFAKAL